ncbi:MAG: rhodanese-like domain-containing protein [Gemmatimonadota bacterium]
MPKLSTNQWLAVVALLLGALAVVGEPYAGTRTSLDARELAMIVEGRADHVTAPELADWIMQGQTDYRLIDIREDTAYARYHIPGAENVPIHELTEYPLFRNERIVLYSGGGIHAAQAWFLLKAMGFPGVYTVLGGFDAWIDEVLYPAAPSATTPESMAEFERAEAVAAFFGGSPRGAGEEGELQELALPSVDLTSPVIVAPRKKRRKEGC